MSRIPRLRMFAGANGSGKSTLLNELKKNNFSNSKKVSLGIYINPDDIEREIKERGYLNLADYQIKTDAVSVLSFFNDSTLLKQSPLITEVKNIEFSDNQLIFSKVTVNAYFSYFASVISDFIRHQLLKTSVSFTFETVMSSPDKIEFLKKSQMHGFKTYLYYITTEAVTKNL